MCSEDQRQQFLYAELGTNIEYGRGASSQVALKDAAEESRPGMHRFGFSVRTKPASFAALVMSTPCPPGRYSARSLSLPKGPKYLYGTKYGSCSSNFPYGLGKYSLYWYLGPFGTDRMARDVIPTCPETFPVQGHYRIRGRLDINH